MSPDYSKIPVPYMESGVRRYIEHGQPVGDFLTALFNNQLQQAVCQADKENLAALRDWVIWLHWKAPTACHGSPEKTKAWMKSGGLSEEKAA